MPHRLAKTAVSICATVTMVLGLNAVAIAAPPKGDLTIELRQIRDGQDTGSTTSSTYTAGPATPAPTLVAQEVRVRNGEKAVLRINQSMPLQWVQKIESQSATISAGGASANQNSGGVTQAVTWMESGQSLTVTPLWPGGKAPVKLEIEVQASAVDERVSSDLPATSRQFFSTTLSAPLHEWVTLATNGTTTKPGSYSSSGAADARRLLQVRVSRTR